MRGGRALAAAWTDAGLSAEVVADAAEAVGRALRPRRGRGPGAGHRVVPTDRRRSRPRSPALSCAPTELRPTTGPGGRGVSLIPGGPPVPCRAVNTDLHHVQARRSRRGLVGEIISRIERKGLTIVAMDHAGPRRRALAEAHYDEHREQAVLRRARRLPSRRPGRGDDRRGSRRQHLGVMRTLIGATKRRRRPARARSAATSPPPQREPGPRLRRHRVGGARDRALVPDLIESARFAPDCGRRRSSRRGARLHGSRLATGASAQHWDCHPGPECRYHALRFCCEAARFGLARRRSA